MAGLVPAIHARQLNLNPAFGPDCSRWSGTFFNPYLPIMPESDAA